MAEEAENERMSLLFDVLSWGTVEEKTILSKAREASSARLSQDVGRACLKPSVSVALPNSCFFDWIYGYIMAPITEGVETATANNSPIMVIEADLSRADHQSFTTQLLDAYAMDPMGDGKPLSDEAKRNLIPRLTQHPTTMVLIAFTGTTPVGLAICFRGFSTFLARPLVNISDYFVIRDHRGGASGTYAS